MQTNFVLTNRNTQQGKENRGEVLKKNNVVNDGGRN